MEKISAEDFKNISFDMLKHFAGLCEKHNLRYVLDYGTLLGAIRHGDFIPWDDDIDVTMPREDYNKLGEITKTNPRSLGEYYRLASYDNEYSVHKAYYNIVDIRTITVSPYRMKRYYYPIWIDVFPMDIMPDDNAQADQIYNECAELAHAAQACVNAGYGRLKYFRRFKNLINMHNQLAMFKELDRLAQSIKMGGRLTQYLCPDRVIDDISYFSYYEDFIPWKFRDTNFRVPRNYDERLTCVYGDYMTLPPVEKRVSHVTEAYWK